MGANPGDTVSLVFWEKDDPKLPNPRADRQLGIASGIAAPSKDHPGVMTVVLDSPPESAAGARGGPACPHPGRLPAPRVRRGRCRGDLRLPRSARIGPTSTRGTPGSSPSTRLAGAVVAAVHAGARAPRAVADGRDLPPARGARPDHVPRRRHRRRRLGRRVLRAGVGHQAGHQVRLHRRLVLPSAVPALAPGARGHGRSVELRSAPCCCRTRRPAPLVAIHTWDHTNMAAADDQNDDGNDVIRSLNGGSAPANLLWRASSHDNTGMSHHQKFVVMDQPDPSDSKGRRALRVFFGGPGSHERPVRSPRPPHPAHRHRERVGGICSSGTRPTTSRSTPSPPRMAPTCPFRRPASRRTSGTTPSSRIAAIFRANPGTTSTAP